MATQLEMSAGRRTVTGKKTRFLRRDGQIPANIYGHSRDSLAVQVSASALDRLLGMASSSTLVNLKVEGTRQPVTVMVREIQRNPRTGAVLHVDFYAVRMSERIRTEVPVHLVGTAPIVNDGIGMLTQTLRSVEVDALPNELPAALEVDISGLVAVHDSVFVRDIKVPQGVNIHADGDSAVASVSPVRAEEVEPEAAPTEPERVAGEREEEEKEE